MYAFSESNITKGLLKIKGNKPVAILLHPPENKSLQAATFNSFE